MVFFTGLGTLDLLRIQSPGPTEARALLRRMSLAAMDRNFLEAVFPDLDTSDGFVDLFVMIDHLITW